MFKIKKSAFKKEQVKKKAALSSSWAGRQPLLPLLRSSRKISAILSILLFIGTIVGYCSYSTIGSGLGGDVDTRPLPPTVKQVRDDYSEIKSQYTRFDFDRFRDITGKAPVLFNEAESAGWTKAAEIFFGLTYLKDYKENINNMKEETAADTTRVQAPAISVSGWIHPTPDSSVVILSYNGRPEQWNFERRGGKWSTNNLPPEYSLDEMVNEPESGAPYFMISLKDKPQLKWKVMLGTALAPAAPAEPGEYRPGSGSWINVDGKYLYLGQQEKQQNTQGNQQPANTQNQQPAGITIPLNMLNLDLSQLGIDNVGVTATPAPVAPGIPVTPGVPVTQGAAAGANSQQSPNIQMPR